MNNQATNKRNEGTQTEDQRRQQQENGGEPLGGPRPESLPHGTTKDQIAEMESEGQAQQSANDSAPTKPAQDDREGRD